MSIIFLAAITYIGTTLTLDLIDLFDTASRIGGGR